jgi:UDP-N-acetylmuramoyl-tripeptide--D-alanyl-D-alanine ligase
MEIAALYSVFLQNPVVQTDTRKLKKGDIYFALKGPSFNGNLFAKQALELGASYAVIDEPAGFEDDRLILTDDALATLQALAKYHRQQFNIPFIAITGSNGKTTTKELVYEVLSTTFKTYTTKGNLNNHIGIPLTILSVQKDAALAVIEMGANHQKEIEGYCKYTLPTHGIITNCGKAHLEGFGGVEGVRKGKGELYDYLRANNGTVFLMNDYDFLVEMSKGIINVKTYGTLNADFVGVAESNKEMLEVSIIKGLEIQQIKTNLVGDYNLPNVLVAIAIGKYFNVLDNKIQLAISSYQPTNSRSQLISKDTNKIILDAYNANPTSMKAAIENIAGMPDENKVLLIGGMMELGDESLAEHTAIIQLINQNKWQSVVLVGGDFNNVPHSYVYFDTAVQAKEWLQQQHFKNTVLLVKGSRSMQMEKVLDD